MASSEHYILTAEDIQYFSYLGIIVNKLSRNPNTSTNLASVRVTPHVFGSSTERIVDTETETSSEAHTIDNEFDGDTRKMKTKSHDGTQLVGRHSMGSNKTVQKGARKVKEGGRPVDCKDDTEETGSSRLSEWPIMQQVIENGLADDLHAVNTGLQRHRTHDNLNEAFSELCTDSGQNLSIDEDTAASDSDFFGDDDGASDGDVDDEVIVSGYYNVEQRFSCRLETIAEESELYVTADETLLLSQMQELDLSKVSSNRHLNNNYSTPGLNRRLSSSMLSNSSQEEKQTGFGTQILSPRNNSQGGTVRSKKRGMKYNIRDQTIVSIGDSTSSIEAPASDSGVDSEPEQVTNSGSNIGSIRDRRITDSFDLYKYVIGECGDLKQIHSRSQMRVQPQPEVKANYSVSTESHVSHPLDELYQTRHKEAQKLRFKITDLITCGCSKSQHKDKKKLWHRL